MLTSTFVIFKVTDLGAVLHMIGGTAAVRSLTLTLTLTLIHSRNSPSRIL